MLLRSFPWQPPLGSGPLPFPALLPQAKLPLGQGLAEILQSWENTSRRSLGKRPLRLSEVQILSWEKRSGQKGSPRELRVSWIGAISFPLAIAPRTVLLVFAYFGYFLIRYFGTVHTASCCHGSHDRG